MRTGGKEEIQQEAIYVDRVGGREGRKEEFKVDMNREDTEEEANTFLHFILPTMMKAHGTGVSLPDSPEVDCITTEGDTNWPQGSTSKAQKNHNCVSSP